MAWVSLIATALGALIAFSGSTLADGLKARREQVQGQLDAQRRVIVECILAINNAHALLRDVATQPLDESRLPTAARQAVGNSGVYAIREQMLISVRPEVVLAAEGAFHSIIAIRDSISAGAKLDSQSYRQANDIFQRAIWELRQATRESFGVTGLDVDKVRRAGEAVRQRSEP